MCQAPVRLRSAALEARYTLVAALRALMQKTKARLISIDANIHRPCQLFDGAVVLMKHPVAPAAELAADPIMAAGLLPRV